MHIRQIEIVVKQFFIVSIGLILLLTTPLLALAQQESDDVETRPPHIQKKIEQLRGQGVLSDKDEGAKKQLNPVRTGLDYSSLGEEFTVFEQDQSWNRNPNPNAAYNFDLFDQGQPVGDINGDGRDDFIVSGLARDETTNELNDQIWKTAVFYGGNTSGTPDQIFRRKLMPTGDLNGDGYTDAVALETNPQYASSSSQPSYIYKGSENGLQQTSEAIDFGVEYGIFEYVASFDFNYDGYDDIVSYFPSGDNNDVIITWGAEQFSDVSHIAYSSIFPNGPKRMMVEDIDDDSLMEMVSLNGILGDGQIQVAKIDSMAQSDPTNGVYEVQRFAFNSFSGYADQKDLHLIDINGSGNPEIYISDGRRGSKYIVEYDTTNEQYFTTADELFNGSLVPAGDLNNDGRHDFIQGDSTNNYKAHISYGPDDLTQELTLDVDLTGHSGSDWNWNMGYNRYNSFGDLNNDGIDDVVLRHTEDANGVQTLGRRIIEGSEAESYNSVFHTYPFENYRSSIVSTQNVGDLNGDGIDDIAMALRDQQKVEIYYGADSISDMPDMTLNLDYFPIYITPGDFNGDGNTEIGVMGYQYISAAETYIDIFSADGNNIYSLASSDFQDVDSPDMLGIFNIGDVNNDGSDDFSTGSAAAHDSTGSGVEYINNAYIFYGGSTISIAPDVTISMAERSGNYLWAGERAVSLGDMNDDGVDDFAISIPNVMNSDETWGQVQVFYGGQSGDYASPDFVFTPDDPSMVSFGWAMASGDFNGDGANDLAAAGTYSGGTDNEPKAIQVYYGGSEFGNETDEHLNRPGFDLDNYESQWNSFFYGTLESLPDFTKSGSDELLFTSSFTGATHAAIYTFNSSGNKPEIVLRAPNIADGLGGPYNAAAGDFNNNGQLDLVLTQMYDNNDAYFSSRVYRYGLTDPIGITSIEDVPDDQGEWVRVSVDGYLMDAMSEDIYGFDSWAVRRMEEDSSWTSVATVKPYSDGSKFVDVRVPKTQPTGDESVNNTYYFKVIAYDYTENNTTQVLAETAVDSGQAFDNIAPGEVEGITIESQTDKIVSWSATDDNDIGKYEIYETDIDGNVAQSAVGSTSHTTTSFSLPDNFEGVRNFVVQVRDVNNNTGPVSKAVSAVYPKTTAYDVNTGWNLIGLPVDADPDSIERKIKDAASSGIFEYEGGYTSVSDMEVGKGYWVKFSEEYLAELGGQPFTELTLNLQEGWNLISGVGGELPVEMIQDPDGIFLAETLYEFDEMYASSDTLRPGNGYWIRASADGTVTFIHPKIQATVGTQTSKKEQPLSQKHKGVEETFGKINISDGSNDRTLYFGGTLSDQIDKRNYSLPPLPPGDIFDARFADDYRLTEEVNTQINLKNADNDIIEVTLNAKNLIDHNQFVIKEYAEGELLTEYTVTGDKSFNLRYSETSLVVLESTGSSAVTDSDIPEEFKLEQNYPNPFNPTTQIEYAVTEQSSVTLEVFNILGRKVATLVNSEQPAGNYQVTFDGSNLASGVYLYRLQAGDKVSTKKFILAK